MRMLATVFCLFASAAVSSAQTVELGGRIAAGCKGSDGSLCDETAALVGAHASLWAGDRVELTAGFARLALPSFGRQAFPAPDVDLTFDERSRGFVSLMFVYHFLRGRPVRPMLGIGSGWYRDARRVSCRPAGCESRLPFGPAIGTFREWDVDAVFVMGLSGVIRDRWVVRCGWQSHRFGNEENSSQQFFVALGYRFGRG